ncbi:Acetoacetyl-CoA reductase [Minicystis rosea]|nr:Acetoacetyl-CoA reductase [Minicystis rosea]
MSREAAVIRAADLRVGLAAEIERDVTEEDILAFAQNSGDHNPLHVDTTYAATTNYGRRIAHGAFQVGLASAMIGMHLPGRDVLLGSANARFLAPLYFPCRVRVRGEITSWNLEERRGTLAVVVREAETLAPTAEIVLGFTLHEHQEKGEARRTVASSSASSGRRRVLVTGAGGGLGRALVSALARDFAVIAVTHNTPLDEGIRALPHVDELRVDLDAVGWEDRVQSALGGEPLYAIVHAAWPGAPAGGLLTAPDDVIARQVSFGTTHTIRLARLLFSLVGEAGGRVVLLGSIYGTHKPTINLAAYSLGKATMESAVRLLGPELARKGITINAVCPTFIAAGMNKQVNERTRMKEAAQIPMGRLCSTDDVSGLVGYLLSDAAAFVSGEVIALSGGQL